MMDKGIISLLADSGIRLNELATIQQACIDWDNLTIAVWGKGNQQRKALFTLNCKVYGVVLPVIYIESDCLH